MLMLDQPVPFREAVKQAAARQAMPTALSSADLSQVNKGILRRSMFSARTEIEGLLDEYKSGIEGIINPTTEASAERVTEANPEGNVTRGQNPAELRTF